MTVTKTLIYFLWIAVLSACIPVHHSHACHAPGPESVGNSQTKVTDAYKLPYMYCKPTQVLWKGNK